MTGIIDMCRHDIHFYETSYPVEQVSEFFVKGLARGDSCFALLKRGHRHAVEQRLRERGIDLKSVPYVAFDSDEILSQLTVDGCLDMSRASDLLTPLMQSASGGKSRVRSTGDLAPTLSTLGRIDDAIAFEELVHRLTEQYDASVICAYPIRTQGGVDEVFKMIKLCETHTAIEFPQGLWARHLMPAPLTGHMEKYS